MAVCPPAAPVAPVENVDAPEPEALIACVGTSALSGELFGHWRQVAGKGSPDAPAKELRDQVMEFLLTGKWVEGEATERGIKVGDRAVRHRLTSQKHAAFKTEREFRQFLEDSGMTRSDLKYRVRLDMLSERIRKDAAGKGSSRTKERRLVRFLSRFHEKWIRRTSCQVAYASEHCGSTFAPPPPPG
jgi:hypothetical protein